MTATTVTTAASTVVVMAASQAATPSRGAMPLRVKRGRMRGATTATVTAYAARHAAALIRRLPGK
ncbi:hypothetical protein MPC38_11240 [Prescottella equi]|uniref:hypothetical protein n=1 Tax=Rhodococcus hoagii TaxID=43767 RepID=UPI001F5B7004|nr:hypothetical protein [Prescottella equi]UNQ41760.1 hypothetical protein MPC38_11240 [Prescottella equi]